MSLPGETLRSHWRRLQGKTIYWVKCCTRMVTLLYISDVRRRTSPDAVPLGRGRLNEGSCQ